MANPEWTEPSAWGDYLILPVKVPNDAPCEECAEDVAEYFAVYEDGGLVDLFDTRPDAEEFVSQQVSA